MFKDHKYKLQSYNLYDNNEYPFNITGFGANKQDLNCMSQAGTSDIYFGNGTFGC